jgi:hypothetical protein
MKIVVLVLTMLLGLSTKRLLAVEGITIMLRNHEVISSKNLKSISRHYPTQYGQVTLKIKNNSEQVLEIDLSLKEKVLLSLVEAKGKKIRKSPLYEVSEKNVLKYLIKELKNSLNEDEHLDYLILDFLKDFDYQQDEFKERKYVVALENTKIDPEVALALGETNLFGKPFVMLGLNGKTSNPNLTYTIGAGVHKGAILSFANGKETKPQFGFFFSFSFKF